MTFGIKNLAAENLTPVKNTNGFPFMHLKEENGKGVSRKEILEWLGGKCKNGQFAGEYRKIQKFVELNRNAIGKKSTVERILHLLRLVRNYENANEMLHAETRREEAVQLAGKKKERKRKKAVEAD